MRKLKVVVFIAVVVSLVNGMALAEDPADFESYMEKIRAQGITESGNNQILTVAAIRLGQSVVTFNEDMQTGRYLPSYQSATCPIPGADPVKLAAEQAAFAKAINAEFSALRPLSDTDGSGFVSSDEASAFRSVFDFGCLVQWLVENSGYSKAGICRASGLDEASLEARLSELDELGSRVVAAGLKPFPGVVRE